MGSSSVVLRLICRKGFAGSSNYSNISWNRTAASCSQFNGRREMMSMTTTPQRQNPSSSSSPWLMLPPASDSSYNFYSLADNKVITLNDHTQELGFINKLKCRGSSRGWLALLSPQNLDLFLFNPISRRHIKLPPFNNLPIFPDDKTTSRDVEKVILSCSPDEDEENCCAVIIHNNNLLALCCPGRSNEWTPFGGEYYRDEARGKNFTRGYYDCAYSPAQKVLFGLTWDDELETWDLRVPSSPRLINKVETKDTTSYSIACLRDEHFVQDVEHLVVAEPELLLRVTQYVMCSVAPDGSYIPKFDKREEYCPHMTIDFDIHKYDPEEGDFKYVHSSSLGGLALFVGIHNQSVAFQATDQQYPELKPNSIYFTEPYATGSLTGKYDDYSPFGGQDIGIFNYEDKTVSPCYYPCDVKSLKKIMPSPMWFFPSHFI